MMPCRQARGVQCETCLSREWPADHLASSQYRCVFRSQADSLSEFDEFFRFQLASFDESADVLRAQMRLLKCQLSRAREYRRYLGIESDVTQRKNFGTTTKLQGRLNRNQAASIVFDVETFQ